LSAGNIRRVRLLSLIVFIYFRRRIRSRIRARTWICPERTTQAVCDRDDVAEADEGIGGGA